MIGWWWWKNAKLSQDVGGVIKSNWRSSRPRQMLLYYVHNQWENGTWKYARPLVQDQMQVPDDQGHLITIPQLGPSEAKCTLGVWLAPDCNNNAEAEYLLEVAKHWQKLMSMAKVTHSAAEFGLQQVILRKPSGGNYVYQTTMHKHHETHSINQTTIRRNHKIVPPCSCSWTMEMGRIKWPKSVYGTIGYTPTYNPQVWRSAPQYDGELITNILQSAMIGIWPIW